MDKTKSYEISRRTVWEAYKLVRANKGAAGVDEQPIQKFEENLKDNLYKIWNRMSSGSYFPPADIGYTNRCRSHCANDSQAVL
jgi:RNA-directed DNA polymerase